jgi:hypothetical protein|tara:strand:+ start:841 stop:1305 length:465 start_codon:yes stop_codon:yes gene_type:complete
MASFAKLKPSNNVVLDVIKIGNDIPTSNGPLGDNDMHVDGETYCTNTFGGTWKQCSETNAFRKQNAGVGDTYDAVKDKFIVQQPHASWTLDANDDWQAPVTIPTDESLIISDSVVLIRWPYWNEEEYRWESHNILADPTVAYHWDTDTDTWVIS